MHKPAIIAVAASLVFFTSAHAQDAAGTTSSKDFDVTGYVPAMCVAGPVTGSGSFDVGLLVDTTSGLLRTDLSAPDQLISGSFCSARSTITISATPMAAQNYTATPPAGYSRSVDYTATASGWTEAPASFETAAASNPAASQVRSSAFTGDITVAVSNFSTVGGSSLRLVGDSDYRGLVTVTLSVAD